YGYRLEGELGARRRIADLLDLDNRLARSVAADLDSSVDRAGQRGAATPLLALVLARVMHDQRCTVVVLAHLIESLHEAVHVGRAVLVAVHRASHGVEDGQFTAAVVTQEEVLEVLL